jgi:hypothetical protein
MTGALDASKTLAIFRFRPDLSAYRSEISL